MKCNTCNTTFEALPHFQKYQQATGCAASLYEKYGDYYILAYYGSSHDMQRFALKTDKYNTGNICDNCIDQLIKDGKAWVIEDGVW